MDTVASASTNVNAASREQRCLWIHRGAVISSISNDHVQNVTYNSIYQQYATRPKRRPLFRYVANSIVVVQEFVLTCYFLGWHRYLVLLQSDSTFRTSFRPFHGLLFDISTTVMYVALLLAVTSNARAITASQNQIHPKNASTAEFYRSKVIHRLVDAVILAFLLRFVSALLHDLTVSYSTDTVELLAALAMILHLLFCDYSYANGYRKPNVANATDAGHAAFGEEISVGVERQFHAFENHRPSFMGGTMSLNAAFFATVLLISRFEESNTVTSTSSFVFVSLSVIIFAFYPVARHTISVIYPPHRSAVHWLIAAAASISTGTLLYLLDDVAAHTMPLELPVNRRYSSTILFSLILLVLLIVVPLWKQYMSRFKMLLRGPWDIPRKASMKLEYLVPKSK